MSYITKNANLILLFFVVLAITFLVGATVFYESNLARINTKYNEKVDLLKATELELQTRLKQLEQSTQALSLKTEREATFTEKYSNVKEEKDTLEGVKADLEKSKASLESEVESRAREIQSLKGQVAISEAEIAQVKEERDEAEDKYATLNRNFNQVVSQFDAYKASHP